MAPRYFSVTMVVASIFDVDGCICVTAHCRFAEGLTCMLEVSSLYYMSVLWLRFAGLRLGQDVLATPCDGPDKYYLKDAHALRAISYVAERLEKAVRASAHLGHFEELVTGRPCIAKKFGCVPLIDEQFERPCDSVSLRNETHFIAMNPVW